MSGTVHPGPSKDASAPSRGVRFGSHSDNLRLALVRDEWIALPRLKSWELMANAIDTTAIHGDES